MSSPADKKAAEAGIEPEAQHHTLDHTADLDENAKVTDFKADAIEAENAEFQMGVIECVRAYPMAATWAFIMSCTIVSPLPVSCESLSCGVLYTHTSMCVYTHIQAYICIVNKGLADMA
jgi:SP family general alpha glucoside:H+ symporter-like MFS transporter